MFAREHRQGHSVRPSRSPQQILELADASNLTQRYAACKAARAPAYSAAKAGVIALTKSLGKELAGYDIAVNCVTPAAARTRIFDQVSTEFTEYMLSKIPRGRFVTVEEIAALIAWLCTRECSFSTGAVFDISGGRATY